MSRKGQQFTNSKKPVKVQNVDTLEKNDAENTEYLSLLPKDYPLGNDDTQDNSMLILLSQKILGDLKNLLIMPFKNFWATLQYNLFLQDSLDLFLRFSPREHLKSGQKPKGLNREYWTIIQEIYRCILWIYVRMVSYAQEDQDGHLCQYWNCPKILYDNWLIDVMKMTDIAQIYGSSNPELVKRIIDSVFNCNKEYFTDFKSTFKQFADKILNKVYVNLAGHTNQSSLEAEFFTEDIRQRMESLTLIIDSMESILIWIKYFPKQCVKDIFNNIVAVAVIEQIYYEIYLARGFTRGTEHVKSYWRIEKLPVKLEPMLEHILDQILVFYQFYFDNLIALIMVVQDKHDRQSISQLNEHIQYILNNMGLVKRKGTMQKKNQSKNDIKEWYLVEGLADKGISLVDILNDLVPWEVLNQVDKAERQELTQKIAEVLENRTILKSIMQGAPQPEEPAPMLDEIEEYNPQESVLDELEKQLEKEQQIKEIKLTEDEQFIQQSEEKLIQVVSKRQQKLTLDLPQDKRAEIARMMINLYDDEPDDTYEPDSPKHLEKQSIQDLDHPRKSKKQSDFSYYSDNEEESADIRPKVVVKPYLRNTNESQNQSQSSVQLSRASDDRGQQYDDRKQRKDKPRGRGGRNTGGDQYREQDDYRSRNEGRGGNKWDGGGDYKQDYNRGGGHHTRGNRGGQRDEESSRNSEYRESRDYGDYDDNKRTQKRGGNKNQQQKSRNNDYQRKQTNSSDEDSYNRGNGRQQVRVVKKDDQVVRNKDGSYVANVYQPKQKK